MSTEIRLLALGALLGLAGCDCEGTGPASQTAPPGPRAVEDAGGGPCPHPYFPLAAGITWRYELGGEEGARRTTAELEVLAVERRGRGLAAKLRRTVGVMETEVEVLCDAEGVSFLPAFVPLGPPVPVAMAEAPAITERTGPLLPAPDGLGAGAEWTQELTAHTELRGRTPLTMDSLWQARGQRLGDREVTVPAGRYAAIQVRYALSVHHRPPEEEDVTFGDRVMDPPAMTFTYSLARGVGVVLIEGEPLPERPHVRARWALASVSRGGGASR